ncbi:hypothetical protein [Clostridioides difficile]|uniref:hypothetical protein n=1 Tax=Clostridioides difficile TaxID=1496 RepID=UPI000C9B6C5A|nr:hypothetical protein [Clostridioides difficile]HBG7285442.1 hypothetical protein [Clostridioides difficile]
MESIKSKSPVLIEVKSDITNKIDLLIEHKMLNNSSHHLNYVLTDRNGKFYFVDANSDLVTTLDSLICPYCLQQLTINRTYEKQNGTVVRFFVKHKSNNKINEKCIFKQKVINGFSKNVNDFYSSKEFIKRNIIFMLKNEIQRGFKISIPDSYTISIEDTVPIKFKYKQHKIEGVYRSNREEFICRLKTDKNETLFCMIGENEINIRNDNGDIWNKADITVIIFNENQPCLNSSIEPKVNRHSNFYTRCLYSRTQKEAYKAYEIECRSKEIKSIDTYDYDEEKHRFLRKRTLQNVVKHELNRVKAKLSKKMGLREISNGIWITNDGKTHEVKGIKIIKDDVYFWETCPEICINYIEPIGYKVERTLD